MSPVTYSTSTEPQWDPPVEHRFFNLLPAPERKTLQGLLVVHEGASKHARVMTETSGQAVGIAWIRPICRCRWCMRT